MKTAILFCFLLAPLEGFAAYANVPWILNGSAVGSLPGRVVLTPPLATRVGSMWSACTINLTQNFDLVTVMNFGAIVQPCGGDGMSFALQNNGTSALGGNS